MADHDVKVTVNWPAPPAAATPPDALALAVRQAVALAYVDTMKGSMDRAMKRVELVTGAAGAIGTIYTGVLALRFGSGDTATPVDGWAVAPAVFLGLAVVLGLGYRLFLPGDQERAAIVPDSAEDAVHNYLVWVSASVKARAWMLSAAVIALAAGVASSPAPYLHDGDAQDLVTWCAVGAGVLFLLSLLLSRGSGGGGSPGPLMKLGTTVTRGPLVTRR